MNISLRFEGGAGDCLLANRFVPAIKECYPNSKITAYIDSEGKTFQKEILEVAYPSFYKEIKVIPAKKYKDFWVDTQFGLDNYYGALENVPDAWRLDMESADLFYDLHIDSLKWTKYDFDWYRYFRFFPRPEINKPKKKQVVCHLESATSTGHRLEGWYIEGLLKRLCSALPNYEIVVIATPEQNNLYEGIEATNFRVLNADIRGVIESIVESEVMISVDSGFRFLAMGCSIPVITFSAHCPAPHQVIPSHMIRWNPFPELTYPLNHNMVDIVNLTQKLTREPGYALVPYLQDFDLQCVRRKYIINKDKSILA